MVIGLSGRIGSGKDLAGALIQLYYYRKERDINMAIQEPSNYAPSIDMWLNDKLYSPDYREFSSTWNIKKYAKKLKQITAILTGCSVEDLESQEFKEKFLPKMWNYELIGDISGVNGVKKISPVFEDTLVKRYTYREFLQLLGTEAVRNVMHQNAWVNALFADYDEKKHNWLITDVRFENEAKAIKERGGIIIRINRGSLLESGHSSETSLDKYKFDCVIDNNGTIEDLYNSLKVVLD